MMTCRQCVELLIDFLDNELSPELRQHLEEHLCQCPPCVVYVETYKLTVHLTHCLPKTTVPQETMQRIQSTVCSHLNKQPPAQGSP